MKRHTLIFGVSVLAFANQGGCGSDRLLVGERNDAGDNPGLQSSGGATGTNNGGSGGATVTRSERPLAITGREALTRMAALIWNAAPDDDLLSQDSSGHFKTVEDLYGPARQMLADPRAAQGVGAFYDWWLHLPQIDAVTKDSTLFPTFNSQLATDMHSEVLAFALGVTLDMSGTFDTLLTAPFSFVNARLAEVYGLSGVTGDNLRQVALNPTERAGLLTLPGLQAQSSNPYGNSPPRRGVAVFESLLCSGVPLPPAGFQPAPPTTPPGTTLRQALAMQEVDPPCVACHQMIDPYGLAFETFDAMGRARTTDNGAPVDVSNLRLNLLDGYQTINGGAVELAKVLAQLAGVQECMARQWLAFALHKSDPNAANGDSNLVNASIAQIMAPFQASNFNLKELIAGVVLTDAFLAPMQP